MSGDTQPGSIADASKPNAGRIYDYLLGGDHNFEIDRQAAGSLLQMLPVIPQWVRVIRWFLGEAIRRLADEGFRHFLDFASGLPTVDHIHQIAPPETKVLYSDLDPVTVAYAQGIVKDLPGVRYVECDAAQPEKLLASGQVEQLFGNTRKVAIGFNGIAWFLPDDQVAHALDVLYDWAGAGSRLFLCDNNTEQVGATFARLADFYTKVGQPIYQRSRETITKLVGRWRVVDPGFKPLTTWIELSSAALERAAAENAGNVIGAILAK